MDKHLKEILGGYTFADTCPVRSRTMGAIKGKGNKTTEKALQMAMVRAGIFGWKLQDKHLPGRPDFIFAAESLAVFVDGCFWHHCEKCGHVPKTRSEFWTAKLATTKARDKRNTQKLKAMGFRVLRLWEHELKSASQREKAIRRITRLLS